MSTNVIHEMSTTDRVLGDKVIGRFANMKKGGLNSRKLASSDAFQYICLILSDNL